jgi:hypothetical protein
LYFKCNAHTFYLGRPSYPGKVFTWKIIISPKQYPASFCRELSKTSYWTASCKQSPKITISFYISRNFAVAEYKGVNLSKKMGRRTPNYRKLRRYATRNLFLNFGSLKRHSSLLEALVKLYYNAHDLKSILNHVRNPLKTILACEQTLLSTKRALRRE